MIRRAAALCLLTALVAGNPAHAQVSVNPGALDSLAPTAEPTAPAPDTPDAPRRARPKHAPRRPAPARKPPQPAPTPKATPAAKAAPVSIAPAPPAAASLAPPPPAPPARPLPAPVVPIVTDAAGDSTAIPGGLRVTFAPGKADLNPATAAALHDFGHAMAPDANVRINVFAFAAGTADDPSTPRRVSLSRALAARAALLSEGIASTRIYVRALGNTPSPGPADRVDVQQVGAAPAPP